MFEALRKYLTVLTLVLAAVVSFCLVTDAYGDAQHRASHTTTCITVVADGFDLDEDEDDGFSPMSFVGDKVGASVPMRVTGFVETERSKRPKALQRGLVRRHFPRNGIANSHKHAYLQTTKSGAEQSAPLFLSKSSTTKSK